MSISFKFRSSANFDTFQLDGHKLTISIGELRWKIMCLKNLNKCPQKDFDLVLSDAATSEEYKDDRFEIASGSSVIVKRVPSELVPSATFRYKRTEENELKGLDQNKPENKVPAEKLEQDSNKQIELDNVVSAYSMDPVRVGLPSESRCHYCSMYYKKAVTIQCCYRNLCDKCIREELIVKGRCPLCSFTRCGVKDLQPNVGHNKSVKKIIESHNFTDAPENALQKYAPDQESGTHGKHNSFAVPVTKSNTDLFDFTSNMMKGSNQYMAESEFNSHDINQPLMMPHAYMPVQGGDQRFSVGNINTTVDRRCYHCGSPDHVIRNCPNLNSHHMSQEGDPMFQGGMLSYVTPYWGDAAFPPVDPYMSMYGTPGMAPFGGSLVPFTPYKLPNYHPATYSNLPVPSGAMMGGLTAPLRTRSELPLTHYANLEPRHGDNRRVSPDKMRLMECKSRKERGKHSHSKKAAGKDKSLYQNVDYENDRYDEMRSRKHHRQSGSDSSRRRHQTEKENGVKRKVVGCQHKVSDKDHKEGGHHKRKERSY